MMPPGWRFLLRRVRRRGGVRCFASARHAVNIGGSTGGELQFETGHLARFADGAAVVSQGDNAILATAVGERNSSSNAVSFLPLTVDFKQSAAAVGRIPTNYLRRELQQSDADVLASRLIDRSIRPLFPKEYKDTTQVICKPLCLDESGDGIVLGVNAASAALAVSDIPWNGPVGAVRIALIDDRVVVNPVRNELKRSKVNMVLSGCADGKHVLMIDMDACEVTAERLDECIGAGLDAIASITAAIQKIVSEAGKPKREASCFLLFEFFSTKMLSPADFRIGSANLGGLIMRLPEP
ncbi:Polyribonucleotide nucleotidyltransferase 1, mitochondrial [Toxocara canis]|uniref:polyribonucleotide nucleotidyltransferase n=1 Tax=Toxocara canis TaxID=6265 RepID=A0A0B2W4T8_TOXCA|nr:Polyribonucleotide nucleotidyltransferase 1, mitochondrial [Toxocara canis]